MNLDFLKELGLAQGENFSGTSTGKEFLGKEGSILESYTPIDNSLIASTYFSTEEQYHQVVSTAKEAFKVWRKMPAPQRGEIVRQIGNKLRVHKNALGKLVSLEMGKIYQEGLGEVQEMIDICDFAVGLSRQLYGLTISSERPNHRMMEQWHPLGICGIISAFNFPVAVWSWNAMIAAVCGDVCIWKPSEKTPLTSIAVQNIVAEVLKENNMPEGIFCLVQGDATIGKLMSQDENIPLISATGSIRMGKALAPVVAGRLGRTILELGGNNALIVSDQSNFDLALRAVIFGSVGTAGQRCTSTRRLIIQEDIADEFLAKLTKIYSQIKIGNPLEADTLVGPLIDKDAVLMMQNAIEELKKQGGEVLYGGEVINEGDLASGNFVRPCIALAKNEMEIVQNETFAPILYVIKYDEIEEAIEIHNNVKQGLSSAIFSNNLLEAERFLSVEGSDCGIANVNIGTSGAEIGGAFGGEKETGGGRESGSDAWKAYMRRQSNTINYGTTLPLAQGISFDI